MCSRSLWWWKVITQNSDIMCWAFSKEPCPLAATVICFSCILKWLWIVQCVGFLDKCDNCFLCWEVDIGCGQWPSGGWLYTIMNCYHIPYMSHLIGDGCVGIGIETKSFGQRGKEGTPCGRSCSILVCISSLMKSDTQRYYHWDSHFMLYVLFSFSIDFSIMCLKLAENGYQLQH